MARKNINGWALLRDWHIWVGVIAVVPIIIVAVFTFFLVHKKTLDVDLRHWTLGLGDLGQRSEMAPVIGAGIRMAAADWAGVGSARGETAPLLLVDSGGYGAMGLDDKKLIKSERRKKKKTRKNHHYTR